MDFIWMVRNSDEKEIWALAERYVGKKTAPAWKLVAIWRQICRLSGSPMPYLKLSKV